ncbi:MAG: thioredoxin domain-containing protein [Bacteroidetes bacterium]|nr:thioredoxin domain-containing protein [Bacteroidota bacterium]
MHKHTNSLVSETSPYLLQHAHNPVKWFAWNDETLKKAKEEDKMILVSIGYSACHWCHVMEHECFEDEEVADLMNEHFINVKIDREERPDIDQVYMTAVQLMTKHGGWPLNCFTLPDGRPIYGGTYFPKDRWMQILKSLANLFKQDRNKAEEYASELTNGLLRAEMLVSNSDAIELNIDTIHKSIRNWKTLLDDEEGGMDKAPKFPLPNNYIFLLRYAHLFNDDDVMKQVHLTLRKMAYGGIYDQLEGGFARYSVDALWKVPHFEKMLYDNAQLISLYSEAFQQSKEPLYKQIVEESISFIETNWSNNFGGYFSALDADSEGVEGKYYVWTKEELHKLLDEKSFDVFCKYYNVNEIGYWEDENYILLRKDSDKELAMKLQVNEKELIEIVTKAKSILLEVRSKRVKPGLDDKTLCSWNALMLKAYADSYKVFSKQEYLDKALFLASFIKSKMKNGEGLFHSFKNDVVKINGFLEDYAFTIEAYISLYEVSGAEEWLHEAKRLSEYVNKHFYDKQSGFFFFTSDEDAELIVRKVEISDNVIPASNSQMARNLFRLHKHFHLPQYHEMTQAMCAKLSDEISHYGSGYSNWAILQLELQLPFKEIAITGKEAKKYFTELNKQYLPNVVFAVSHKISDLPLLKDRLVDGKTLIYVCENNACNLPLENVAEFKS